MKNSIYAGTLTMLTLFAGAQTLPEAITKTENERFDVAASELKALIAKEPNKGENYFYLGENYFKNGSIDENKELIDSAAIFYGKGIELNATQPLNYVGMGKVLLYRGKVDEAKTQLFKAASIAQNKNAEVMRKTAEAWLVTENKNADEALNQANSAVKLDPKNPESYIILGDAQLEKNPMDGSPALKSYQMATSLNPKSVKGILREGRLYRRGRNYPLALEKYRAALAIDPTFAPAYREIAEVYYLATQNAKSIENWKKYLELNNSDAARYSFLNALFKNKQYADVLQEYDNLKKANFKKPNLDRLAAYSFYELGDKTDKEAYQKGMKAMDEFFEKAGPNFKYLGSDYKYKGMLMMKNGKDSLGMIELEKALAVDPAIAPQIYREIAQTSYKAKKYDKATTYFEKQIAADPKSLDANDWFNYGRAYYSMGVGKQNEAYALREVQIKKKKDPETAEVKQKDEEAKKLYTNADSAFSKLALLQPNWIKVYLYRGKANAGADPKAEKDLAKGFYEKVLTMIKPEEKTTTGKNDFIEANEYLGYYFTVKNNNKANPEADKYWNAVREVDPANEKAKAYFTPPKPAGPKPGGH